MAPNGHPELENSGLHRVAIWRVRPLETFLRDTAGAVNIMFAFMIFAAIGFCALAIDYGMAEREFTRMQRAADSATLAASHRLGQLDQDTSGPAVAQKFFVANTRGQLQDTLDSVQMDPSAGEVRLKASGSSLTFLMGIFGINKVDRSVTARVVRGDGTVEIALVLDNSGSMGGQPIADLITASQNLITTVFNGTSPANPDRVKVGVVPFAAAVNVGAGNRASTWVDQNGISPTNAINFSENVPRFTLYDRMGVAWKGCVEARTAPQDAQDTPGSAGSPASLFVPMFAPDEPDGGNDGGSSYSNSYLADDAGSCPKLKQTCIAFSRRGNCTQYQTETLTPQVAQARTCKYDGSTPAAPGPNYMCDSKPVLPLTNSKSDALASVGNLTAKGNTNIGEGVMWGWRVLSPGEPFPEGRAYDTPKNEKIMIVMTDGANTYSTATNHNKSNYGAFNYAVHNRLGTTYTNTGLVSNMNSKTLAACQNAKATGIKIYTIAFRLESDPATMSLLRSCATEPTMAYGASDGAALYQVFEMIGREISQLRVAG